MSVIPSKCTRCNKPFGGETNRSGWCLSCHKKIKECIVNKQCIVCGDTLKILGEFKCSLCREDEIDPELVEKRVKIAFNTKKIETAPYTCKIVKKPMNRFQMFVVNLSNFFVKKR